MSPTEYMSPTECAIDLVITIIYGRFLYFGVTIFEDTTHTAYDPIVPD